MDENRKFDRLHRLRDADPEIFQAFPHYARGVQSDKQPMIISKFQKTRLLNTILDPLLLQEINNGVTYRGNHYFSPRHFCYQCDIPFLSDDPNHTNHRVYNANINYMSYVGFYTGKYSGPRGYYPGKYSGSNTLFLVAPCISDSIHNHYKFINHVKKYMESDRFITMYCTVALGCNIMIVNALLPHVVKRRALTFAKT